MSPQAGRGDRFAHLLEHSKGLGGEAVRVAIWFILNGDRDTAESFKSTRTIATELGVQKSTVTRAFDVLIKHGLMVVTGTAPRGKSKVRQVCPNADPGEMTGRTHAPTGGDDGSGHAPTHGRGTAPTNAERGSPDAPTQSPNGRGTAPNGGRVGAPGSSCTGVQVPVPSRNRGTTESCFELVGGGDLSDEIQIEADTVKAIAARLAEVGVSGSIARATELAKQGADLADLERLIASVPNNSTNPPGLIVSKIRDGSWPRASTATAGPPECSPTLIRILHAMLGSKPTDGERTGAAWLEQRGEVHKLFAWFVQMRDRYGDAAHRHVTRLLSAPREDVQATWDACAADAPVLTVEEIAEAIECSGSSVEPKAAASCGAGDALPYHEVFG